MKQLLALIVLICGLLGVNTAFGAAAEPEEEVKKEAAAVASDLPPIIGDIWRRFMDELAVHVGKHAEDNALSKQQFLTKYLKQAMAQSPDLGNISPQERDILQHVLLAAVLELFFKGTLINDEIAVFKALLDFMRADAALNIDAENHVKFLSEIEGELNRFIDLPLSEKKVIELALNLRNHWFSIDDASFQDAQKAQWTAVLDALEQLEKEGPKIHIFRFIENSKRMLDYLRFRQRSLEPDSPTAAEDAQILENIRIQEKILFGEPYELLWCPCLAASWARRIALVVRIVTDALQRHPDKNARLVYASLGSGRLLQDYLVIHELRRQGYTNIDINIIDQPYISLGAIEKLIQVAEKEGDENQKEHLQARLNEVLNHTFYRSVFKRKVGVTFDWGQATHPVHKEDLDKEEERMQGIHLTSWQSVNDYRRFVEQNPTFSPDVITMVDRDSLMFHGVPNSVRANAVLIIVKGAEADQKKFVLEKPSLYMSLSLKPGIEAYTNIKEDDPALKVLSEHIENTKTENLVGPELGTFIVATLPAAEDFEVIWYSDLYTALYDIALVTTKKQALVYILDYINYDTAVSAIQVFTVEDFLQTSDPLSLVTQQYLKRYRYRPYTPIKSRVCKGCVVQ